MGNQLIKDTNVDKEAIGSGGVTSHWAMHGAQRNDKNKTPVTAFLLDKKIISKAPSNIREEFLVFLRKEPQSIARFKHPNILSILDPLIEDQRSMAFVTESVKGSLLTFINSNNVAEIFPTEIDTKFHILDLAETLSFLHNDVKSCHLGVSPENIYVLADEKWKLGGFTFTNQLIQGGTIETNIDFNLKIGENRLSPNLKFSAPEVASNSSKCSFASDVFSLGCLIYTLYKINQDKNTNNPYLMNVNSVNNVQETSRELYKQNLSCIPDQIRSVVSRMLNPDPNQRISISDFLGHSWFRDPFIQTVKYLETLYQRDFRQQQTFLKGLTQIIVKFEKKFVLSKVLPLLNNLVKNEQLAASILPIYFSLINIENKPFLTREEFHNIIWPTIKSLATGKEMPAQALYLLIQNLSLLVELADIKEMQIVFTPLLIKSFECGVQKLQVLALQKTELLFGKIEYSVSKNQMLPRILNLCVDGNITTRKEAIVLLSKVYNVFDKTVINDQILTTLEKVRKLTNNYQINMTMLSIFEGISKNIGIDVIANKLLVAMLPMLVDQTLTKPEYKAYMSTVRAYLKRIEEEQDKFYENSSDQIPQDMNEEFDKKETKREEKIHIGNEFEFLDFMNAGSSDGYNGNSGNEPDFTGFDEQYNNFNHSVKQQFNGNSEFTKNSGSVWQNSTSNSSLSMNKTEFNDLSSGFDSVKSNTSKITTNNQNKFPSSQQNCNSSGIGVDNNKNSSVNSHTQKTKQSINNDFNTSNQLKQPIQNQNMFNNMNMKQPIIGGQTSGQYNYNQSNNTPNQNKWDTIDSEFGDLNTANMNWNPPTSNQNFAMNSASMTSNTGFNSISRSSNNIVGTNQFSNASSNLNSTGWDNMEIDVGGTQNIDFSSGQGIPFNSINNNNNKQTNIQNDSIQGSNIRGSNQASLNQSKPKNFSSGAMQIGQKSVNVATNNKNTISNSDDFFDSFNIQGSGNKKTNTAKFGGQNQSSNNNDLL